MLTRWSLNEPALWFVGNFVSTSHSALKATQMKAEIKREIGSGTLAADPEPNHASIFQQDIGKTSSKLSCHIRSSIF